MNYDMNTVILAVGILLIVFVLLYTSGAGREDDAVYQSLDPEAADALAEEQNNVAAQRVSLILSSINMIWNSLVIDQWLRVDGCDVKDAITTDPVLFSEDKICVYSTYLPRSLKITCQLEWSKQKMYVRIEQQLEDSIIEVSQTVKLKAGVMSITQVDSLTELYFKMLMKIVNHRNKTKDLDTTVEETEEIVDTEEEENEASEE